MGFTVWVQNAGDLLVKEFFYMCPEDIVVNNGMYSYACFFFLRQCMSALGTMSILLVLFDLCWGLFK